MNRQPSEAVLALQVADQIQDHRLHGHIQRRGRLVEHQEARVQHQRAGDREPLALAARELVREAVVVVRGEADMLEHLHDALAALAAAQLGVDDQRLAQDVADRPARVQRRIGVLEHDLELRAQLARGHRSDRPAAKRDLARGRRDEIEHQACDRALAAAGFTGEAEDLVGADIEADAVDRLDRLLRGERPEGSRADGKMQADVTQ